MSFIHVGMIKTASTYLQSVWLKDEQYALAFSGAGKVVQYIRQSTLRGDFDANYPMNIELDKQPIADNNVIISSEGFSAAYLTAIEERPVRTMMGNAAEILGTLNKETDNVLICVRSPVAWMKSVHAQFINEGQYGNWDRFFAYKEQFLKDALDLEYMLSCYEKFFNNVVVMPFEYLKQDEPGFWEALSSHFDVPRPKVQVEVQNESLKGARLRLLSSLNRVSYVLRSGLSESCVSDGQEIDFLIKNDANYSKWVHRRFCQYASEESLLEACNLLGVQSEDASFNSVSITREMADWVEDKFIKSIEKRVSDQDLIENYRAELLKAVID
ncbi:hypothetical protein [Marinobacter persicus]|uniref:hypothetical protein n=1 Tax=Marinobacter persicus TaxID=930118 RepID=UPI001160C7A4|nr:hypothetical protein [Marinobacter persicus]